MLETIKFCTTVATNLEPAKFLELTFHPIYAARKFAIEPPMMSMYPSPPYMFAMMFPNVTPRTTGIPNTMDRGIRASATLTWNRRKLMGARRTTPIAYRAAIMDPNAIFLVSSLSPPDRGFYSGTVGGPTTRMVGNFRLP